MNLKHKIKLALPLILFGVFYIVSFKLLEGIEWEHYITPYVAIDHMIPFVPAFVIPYLAWFIWVPFVLIVLLFEDEKEFCKSKHMLMIGMTLFLLFSADTAFFSSSALSCPTAVSRTSSSSSLADSFQ